MKPLFSIASIMKNESKHLARLFKSLEEFKSKWWKVFLADTGSTDNSVQIARDWGAIVYECWDQFRINIDKELSNNINNTFIIEDEWAVINEWDSIFDFWSARDWIVNKSELDYNFCCDMDEAFTNLDIDYINQKIIEGIGQFEYHFVFSHYPDGSPYIQFTQCKFFDRRRLKWSWVIHECIQGSAERIFIPREFLLLEHFQNQETNRNWYLKWLALDCYNNRWNDRQSHYFARECMYKGKFKSAIKEFERHIAMNKWNTEKSQSMLYIWDCCNYLWKQHEAKEWYLKALATEPNRREPFIRLAQIYFHHYKDWQNVVVYMKAALEIPETHFYANDSSHYTFVPHEYLYQTLWWMWRQEESKIHFDKCLEYKPHEAKYLHDTKYYYEYHDINIEWWMTFEELTFLYKSAKKYNTIAELWSWAWRSSHALLSWCKWTVTCIDTFQWSNDINDKTLQMAKDNDIYERFINNVWHFKNLKVIKWDGTDVSKTINEKFEMIFIDAEHKYEWLKNDIKNWLPKCTKMICWHDYCEGWKWVIKAVDEKFWKPDEVHWSIWVYYINRTIPKRIFSIWLNQNKIIPPLINKCLKSIKIDGYENRFITLDNCYRNDYINKCIEDKNYVQAVDYLRLYYIYTEWWIYLDSDMELIPWKTFDNLLSHPLFACREDNWFIANSAFWATKW